jgi:uncharacterized protein YfaQ (DUF2300 family)
MFPVLLALHTNGSRNVPRPVWGSEFTTKAATLVQGGSEEIAAGLNWSVARKPLWLPAFSSVCSLLTLFSESLESSLYGSPALYCYNE